MVSLRALPPTVDPVACAGLRLLPGEAQPVPSRGNSVAGRSQARLMAARSMTVFGGSHCTPCRLVAMTLAAASQASVKIMMPTASVAEAAAEARVAAVDAGAVYVVDPVFAWILV